jgi:hypothetical protein
MGNGTKDLEDIPDIASLDAEEIRDFSGGKGSLCQYNCSGDLKEVGGGICACTGEAVQRAPYVWREFVAKPVPI